ncbi:MAG: phage tail sheath C-terminal domain-containing protein, partial [Candidatus Poseidoniales archaeon]
TGAMTPATAVDWYDQQNLDLTNATISWKSIAPRPTTNVYVSDRNGHNDGIHIVVVDDKGSITGIKGNLIEKHTNLSKAGDAISNVNAPQRIYYKDYLADFSDNIYAGANPSEAFDAYYLTTPRATGFSTDFTAVTTTDGLFGLDAQNTTYSALGNVPYTFGGGVDYSTTGGMSASLASLITSYNLFENKDEIEVDYLIMGPGCSTKEQSQAKANKLIALANSRKDCMALIGPHRADLVGVTNTTTQTDNLIDYFTTLTSSSYAAFDSGYKYQYDRFNNQFRYVPANADVAGMICRTGITAFPWFSPAGQQRGVINNAVKLAYNPTKAQRDRLYPQRINSFVTTPGIGTILFGDKTALGYASAFDRINVRRLFLTVEQALERAAQAQLFELNDDITRANFRNIVEPYLRDIQAKRGLYGFLVVCDTTNNTPDVIDNNEFRADIFLKPAKSINFVTLTFVATRTGVSFEEVAGRV